jgi:hypothetical protein
VTLDQLLQAHQAGRVEEALAGYLQIIREHPEAPHICYMNASALLRQKDQAQEAVDLLQRALRLYPAEAGLWNNFGNALRDLQRWPPAIQAFRQALAIQPAFADARLGLAAALRQQGLQHLAYAALVNGLALCEEPATAQRFYQPLVEVLLALPEAHRGSRASLIRLVEALERDATADGPRSPGRRMIAMAQIWLQLEELDRALNCRDQALAQIEAFFAGRSGLTLKAKFHTTWHALNWNLAIVLLQHGDMQRGWSLYDHGLQVPAEGAQRWQRSLFKPFTPADLPIWRGEPLAGKRILLLGEQGIGDAMMFATLLPRLQAEGASIALAPGDRLLSLYQRSLPDVAVVSTKDLRNGACKPGDFHYQSPLGSIVQYRFSQLVDFAPRSPFLVADPALTQRLRDRYRQGEARPLIGISWQGGGKPKRIAAKSIALQDLTPLLSRAHLRFVSLQYGDAAPHLKRYRKQTGLEIIHDPEIDSLKDMDAWHSQVAAMDAVISIANTTIHGAGGLGVPTLCLLSRQADWRWVKPEIHQGCYWYPSVEVAYQNDQGSWQPALEAAAQWLDGRFPRR